MGVAVADYDCDGWLDIFKTNFADDTCNLYSQQRRRNLQRRYILLGNRPSATSTLLGVAASLITIMTAGRTSCRSMDTSYPEIEGHELGQTYKNPRLVYKELG